MVVFQWETLSRTSIALNISFPFHSCSLTFSDEMTSLTTFPVSTRQLASDGSLFRKRLIHFVSATRENGACQSDRLNCSDLSHTADVSGWGARCSGCLSSLTIVVAWWVKRRTWLESRQCWRREWWRAGNKSGPSERSLQLPLGCCSFYSHSDVFTKGGRSCSSPTRGHCPSRGVWWKNLGGKKNLLLYFVVRVCLRAVPIRYKYLISIQYQTK